MLASQWKISDIFVGDRILKAHTVFLLGQIEGCLPEYVEGVLLSPSNSVQWREFTSQEYRSLADALRGNDLIDWNSCSLSGETILDGWKRKCIVEYRSSPAPSIRLISYGRDGARQTDDDIVREIDITNERNARPRL